MFDREMAELIVHATSGKKDRIKKAIGELGYKVIDDTEPGSKFFNLKVKNPDGSLIRIYKSYRGPVEVQKWEPLLITYSGIPTFEPSGRRSI